MEPLSDKSFENIKKRNSRHLNLNRLHHYVIELNHRRDEIKEKNIYSTCDKCGKVIQYGETHVNFSKYIEYVEYVKERNRTEAEVINAVNLFTLCESCGKVFDHKTIKSILNWIR